MNNFYEIKKATLDDVPYIASIMHSRWGLKEKEAASESSKYLAHNADAAAWILFYENERVGVSLFDAKNLDVSENYGPWLLLLWIEPKHRGNRLGIKLTQTRMFHAKSFGYKCVYIDTTDALDYHLRFGWKKVIEIDYLGEKDTILQYDLSEPFPIEEVNHKR